MIRGSEGKPVAVEVAHPGSPPTTRMVQVGCVMSRVVSVVVVGDNDSDGVVFFLVVFAGALLLLLLLTKHIRSTAAAAPFYV